MRLGEALPELSVLAIPSFQQWELRDRLRSILARHAAHTAVDIAHLSLDEIGLWPNIGRECQHEAATAAVDALSRGALERSPEAARAALQAQ